MDEDKHHDLKIPLLALLRCQHETLDVLHQMTAMLFTMGAWVAPVVPTEPDVIEVYSDALRRHQDHIRRTIDRQQQQLASLVDIMVAAIGEEAGATKPEPR